MSLMHLMSHSYTDYDNKIFTEKFQAEKESTPLNWSARVFRILDAPVLRE